MRIPTGKFKAKPAKPLYSVRFQRAGYSDNMFPINSYKVIAALLEHFETEEPVDVGCYIEIRRVS
jgi:hypothetical protein